MKNDECRIKKPIHHSNSAKKGSQMPDLCAWIKTFALRIIHHSAFCIHHLNNLEKI